MEEKQYLNSFDPKIWKKLLPMVRPYYLKLGLVGLMMIGTAVIDILIPLFLRYAIDNFIGTGTTQGIVIFGVVYALVLVVQGLLVVFFSKMSMTIEMSLGRDLKRRCFVHLQQLSFSYYNQTPVGYILARVMSDTNRISGLIAWSLIDFFWAFAYIVGVFAAMLALNVKLAFLVMIVVPLVVVVTALFQGKILKANRFMRSVNSHMTGAYNEGITGAKTAKTLVIEDKMGQEFADVTHSLYKASMRASMLNAAFIPIVGFLGSMAAALVLQSGGYLVIEQTIQFGVLSAFISYALGILEPVSQAARVFAELISTQVNIERVTSLLEQECAIQDSPQVVQKYGDCFDPKVENWEPLVGDITFDHVSFKYPDGGDYVLQDFNLHIPAGTNVAIVGETGAGKSTLVNLACRFFEPTSGQVLIDGVDYRQRSQLWLHAHLGYVLQTPHLFSGTVMENIRYGNLQASDEQVLAAAKLVSADTVVQKLEKGYQTDVGEGGDRLSTGEKQLISFARAVLADPQIFVLDEATSSIDTETEQLIQNAISHILKGRTSFLIAHRLSTVRHADLILVVKDGKIMEQGTHAQLLAQNGIYKDLYAAMALREKQEHAKL